MENKKLRQQINQYAIDNDVEITLLDNPYFDNSIIGISDTYKLIYDYESMIEEFMEDNSCDYEDAIEFIDYNTMRALPYFENAPIVLTTTNENLKYHYE